MPDEEKATPLIEAENLTVEYAGGETALRGISFSARRGCAFGIVGESGAGKSTVALALLGLLPTDAKTGGSLKYDGTELLGRPEAVKPLRWKRLAIVFQDSMNVMNPVITVGEQIAELFVIHRGLPWKEGLARSAEVLRSVGLGEELLKSFPHQLSGGMRQRAVIAMAVALEPELLVVDEPTAALDVVTQNQIIDLLNALRRDKGLGILLIAHDISAVARTCERMAVMYQGRIVEEGPVERILSSPAEDYTRKLIDAVPKLPGEQLEDAEDKQRK